MFKPNKTNKAQLIESRELQLKFSETTENFLYLRPTDDEDDRKRTPGNYEQRTRGRRASSLTAGALKTAPATASAPIILYHTVYILLYIYGIRASPELSREKLAGVLQSLTGASK